MGETIALNRTRPTHEYSIEDTFEAGIVLRGTEIKSVRAHKVSLADAYARIERDEAWIDRRSTSRPGSPPTSASTTSPSAPGSSCSTATRSTSCWARRRPRASRSSRSRSTSTTRARRSCELGLARGKQTWDRRREIADRDAKRDMERQVAEARKG